MSYLGCSSTQLVPRGGGGSATVNAGTALHQTLRWDGSEWQPSSTLLNDNSTVGINSNPSSDAHITVGAGTNTLAPIRFTAGVLLNVAVNLTLETDASGDLYWTDGSGSRVKINGNGIYGGSDTVPSGVVATLTDTLAFTGGNVSIGGNINNAQLTVSSSNTWTVTASDSGVDAVMVTANAGNFRYGNVTLADELQDRKASIVASKYSDSDGGNLSFWTKYSISDDLVERVRIEGSGFFGIVDNSVAMSASSPLHVAANNSQTGPDMMILQQNSGTGDCDINFKRGASNWTIGVDTSDSDAFKIHDSNNLATNSLFKMTSSTLETDSSLQVIIGSSSLDSSALLGVVSTTKGFLMPVMSTAQKNAIGSPAEGLMVYDSDIDSPYYYDATSGTWKAFGTDTTIYSVDGTFGSGRTGTLTDTLTFAMAANGSAIIGSGYIENTNGVSVSIGAGGTYESLYVGASITTSTNLIRRVVVVGTSHTLGATAAVTGLITVGASNQIKGGLSNIVAGDSIIHNSGDRVGLFGFGHTNTGGLNYMFGQNNSVTGEMVFNVGDNNSVINNAEDVAIFGRNSRVDGNLNGEGFFIEYSNTNDVRPSFAVVRNEDPNNDLGVTTSDLMNIGLGSHQIGRKDIQFGAAFPGAGAGILYISQDVVVEPALDITDAVAIWAKDRAAGETGLVIKSESGVRNFIGDLSGFGTDSPTAQFQITSNESTGFLYEDNTNIQLVRMNITGFMALGATGPSAKLHISDNISASAWGTSGIAIRVDAATYTDSSTAGSGTAASAVMSGLAQPTLAASNLSVTTTNAATFYIANAPADGSNMTITNAWSMWVDAGDVRFDGNVGIGVTTASGLLAPLHVKVASSSITTALSTADDFIVEGDDDVGMSILMNADSTSRIAISTSNSSYSGLILYTHVGAAFDNFDFYVQSSATPTIRMVNNKVAINQAVSATEDLDVANNARFRNIGSTASAGALHYDTNGVLTTNTSDRRMKKDIVPIFGALDKIDQLQGVYYKYKDQPHTRRIGLIYQDVLKVVPELTLMNKSTGIGGVHYADTVALLIEGIKEQQKQIEELKSELNGFRNH